MLLIQRGVQQTQKMSSADLTTDPFRKINMTDRLYFVPQIAHDARPTQFIWEKPRQPNKEIQTAALCYEQAQFLHEVVKDKNKEISILRKQLMKVNEMNYNLVRDLDRYGKGEWKQETS